MRATSCFPFHSVLFGPEMSISFSAARNRTLSILVTPLALAVAAVAASARADYVGTAIERMSAIQDQLDRVLAALVLKKEAR